VGGVSLKKIVGLLIIAFLIFFVVQSPAEAARVVKLTGETLGDWLGEVAQALSDFISSLV
jgi:hypothetical protein